MSDGLHQPAFGEDLNQPANSRDEPLAAFVSRKWHVGGHWVTYAPPSLYYEDDSVTLYHGDVRGMCIPVACESTAWVTDPPYPNNAGHFDESVDTARDLLALLAEDEAIIFWSELEQPPVSLPLVAVHAWHRSNVNGRPWEAAYQFAPDGKKRRSEVLRHPAIFDGAGPGCNEYLGHPTQKPVALMRQLVAKTDAEVIFDPFAGSGSTLRAAKDLGRLAVGVEIEERYCEIAAKRLAQEVLDLAV